MARQVYYDPFGSRLAGYRAGVQDETGLQEQTRRARVADYDFNNFAPLRLSQAQRQDQLETTALPYQQQAYGIQQRAALAGLFGAEQPNFERIGSVTGNYAPAIANAQFYGSNPTGAYLQNPEAFAPYARQLSDMFRGVDITAPTYGTQMLQDFGIGPEAYQAATQGLTGVVGPQAEAGYDQYLGFDRGLQLAQQNRQAASDIWQQQYQQGALNNQAVDAQVRDRYNQAMIQAAQLRAAQAAYGVYGMPGGQAQGQPDEFGFDF